jgi:hypothetical protein
VSATLQAMRAPPMPRRSVAGSAASGANSFAGANSAVASDAPSVAIGDAAHGTATMRDPPPITSFDLKRIRFRCLFFYIDFLAATGQDNDPTVRTRIPVSASAALKLIVRASILRLVPQFEPACV